jgi:hypothetical protein
MARVQMDLDSPEAAPQEPATAVIRPPDTVIVTVTVS